MYTPADDQRRQLADAVAEAEPRLAEQGRRKTLGAAGSGPAPCRRSCRYRERRSRAWTVRRARTRAARSTFLPQHVPAQCRRRIEDGPHDRSVSAMLEQLGSAPQVRQVITAKRQGRGRDPLLEIVARDCRCAARRRVPGLVPGLLGQSQTRWAMTGEPRRGPASPAAIQSSDFRRTHGHDPSDARH